jgi:alkylhydroperoxidase family enzyme
MDPMFLLAVEHSAEPSAWQDAIRMLQAQGAEYPQIWHMFAFKPEATVHLARFTQAIMREAAPISPGLRELIAAYTSAKNHCPF